MLESLRLPDSRYILIGRACGRLQRRLLACELDWPIWQARLKSVQQSSSGSGLNWHPPNCDDRRAALTPPVPPPITNRSKSYPSPPEAAAAAAERLPIRPATAPKSVMADQLQLHKTARSQVFEVPLEPKAAKVFQQYAQLCFGPRIHVAEDTLIQGL